MRGLGWIVAAAAALLIAAGCAGEGDGGEAAPGPDSEATTPAETPADGAVRVGLVTDVGQLNDRGFNQLAFEGLQRAERELGVEGRVIESASDAEYVPNFLRLAEDGFDLVIGVGFAQGDAVAQVAPQYPHTRFAIIDVDQQTLPGAPQNVVGLMFEEEEAGYLAGYLAALVVRDEEEGDDVISSVGGMKEPPVDRFIAGYQAGAEAALPGITLMNGYSQDWDDLAKCKEVALDQIDRGSRVVFQVAGGCGLGALDAAKEQGVWGIGVDADQSFLGDHVLTSAMKRVDQAVFRTIQGVVDGTGEFGLGTISDRVPQEHVEAVERIRERIISGEISDIPSFLP